MLQVVVDDLPVASKYYAELKALLNTGLTAHQSLPSRPLKLIRRHRTLPDFRRRPSTPESMTVFGISPVTLLTMLCLLSLPSSITLRTGPGDEFRPAAQEPVTLDTKDPAIRLKACRKAIRKGDAKCLAVLPRLLLAKEFHVRLEAMLILHSLSKERFGYSPGQPLEQQRVAALKWLRWARAAQLDDSAGTQLPEMKRIDLLNGKDFQGWQAIDGGRPTPAAPVWTYRDGIIACSGKAKGYLRTEKPYDNYILSVEWRWPEGTGGDSGIFFMLSDEDALIPNGLEAQLYSGRAGDFWSLGAFQAKVSGKQLISYARKRTETNEKPIGEWNRMQIAVYEGNVTVLVNGTLQNGATEGRRSGRIGLQVEGDAIEFRNLELFQIRAVPPVEGQNKLPAP